MPIIPSNAGKKTVTNSIEVAREKLTIALSPFFKGKTADKRLKKAAAKAVEAIAELITAREVVTQKKGGTIMTEAASMKNPVTGLYTKAPRNL